MVILIFLLLSILYNLVNSWNDSERIKTNQRIYHGINGVFYFLFVLIAYFFSRSFGLVIGLALFRIPVFNLSLNRFRGLPLNYLSSKTTSKIDKLTYSIQQKVGVYTYYIIILIISLLFSFDFIFKFVSYLIRIF